VQAGVAAGKLLGHLWLTLAIVAYARFVYLDAQGELSSRQRDKAAGDSDKAADDARREADSKTAKRQVRKDRTHASIRRDDLRAPAKSNTATAVASKRAESKTSQISGIASGRKNDAATDSQDTDDERQLSKTERRRLRKLKRREASSRAG
jgi:hypothetical protein